MPRLVQKCIVSWLVKKKKPRKNDLPSHFQCAHSLHDIDVQVAEHVLARLIILAGAFAFMLGVLEFQGLLDF